ncbi:MAG: T9SS type A sorting domain-containing protein [Flavobacteriales bacterium]|nr:T9SS type A sorting domain-containing protein [Flavobacteriales bacterium]
MKHILTIIISIFISITSFAQGVINEGFESGGLHPFMSFSSVGTFSSAPGIKANNSFGSSNVFGFGKSTCSSSCFDVYKTTLTITFPAPTYVYSIKWKEMEIYGNWGSQGQVFLDGVALSTVGLGAQPVNSGSADASPRLINLSINQTVSSIVFVVNDITNASEIIIDDLEILTVNLINGYEYWFDNDFANKTTTPVAPTQQLVVNQLVSTSGLTSGIHTFNFRSFDNNGVYSSVASSFFYKTSAISNNPNPTVVAYEYWLDNDFANAVTVSTPAQQQVNVNELISMSAIPSGIHTFNIRFKDNLNVWSSVASSFFYKTSAISNNPNPTVVAYEYWLDYDFANAVAVSTPAQQQVNVNELISMSAIPSGIHTFNIRFKDNLNVWSSVASSFFYKSAQQTVVQNQVVGYRYWFDNDFANAVYMPLTANQQVNVMDNLDMTQIAKGMHQVHFQFKDTLQHWSVVVADSVEKISLPIANFAYTPQASCDSTTVQFSDLSIDGDTYFWEFGDGATDTTATPTHSYYTPGSYLVSLTVIDTLTLADSTYQTAIFITGNTAHSFAITTCDSYTSPSGNYTFTTSGTYYDTIPNQWGCDSLLTILATINYASSSTDVITACNSYTWIDGNTYTANNNTATHILTNAAGCDSIVTLNLTINTVDVSVTQNSTILTANVTGATYQWLDCDNGYAVINGETNQSFTATQNGNYAVEVLQNNCTDTSSCYSVTNVSVVQLENDNLFRLYPNPVSSILNIETNNNISIKIVSILGETIVEKKLLTGKNSIDVSTLATGIYFIQSENGENVKFIKK